MKKILNKFFYLVILSIVVLQSCKSENPIGDVPDFSNTNFEDRTYIVHVPQNYNADNPAPLMFAIHGIGGDAESTQHFTGFDELSEEQGYIVVYPNSYDGFWGDGCNCQYVELIGIDDVKFIDYLVDKMKNEYNIDTNRIYAWGWSQGGIFVNQLACRRSEVFAAFASYVGTMRLPIASACFPKKPVNMVMFNGTDDQDVYWDGLPSTEFAFLSIPDLFQKWAGLSSCTGEPVSEMFPDSVSHIDVEKLTYEDCSSNKEVVLYKIIRGVHALYRNKEIDTSEETIKFFNKHRLNE
jgi:polyhydroxybutyrate depolymerase